MRPKENKGLVSNGLFYCEHISESDINDISCFTANHQNGMGLALYLQNRALIDELNYTMRTYLVRDIYTDELVGYFSLKAGLISGKETATEISVVFDTLPGIELANFAINSSYLMAHPSAKGIGLVVFTDFIMPLVKSISSFIGVKFLYIFALPFEHLIDRYKDYGFTRLAAKEEEELHHRLKPKYDKGCIFMYQRIDI